MILPPEWKCLLIKTWYKLSDSFEHPWFYYTEKKIGLCSFYLISLPHLLESLSIFWSSCPNSILNCFMNIIIIRTSYYNAECRFKFFNFQLWVDVFKMWKGLYYRFEIAIVLGFFIRPQISLIELRCIIDLH